MKIYLFVLSLFLCGVTFAQNTITGKVIDSYDFPIPGVNIIVVGENAGVVTDNDGVFLLKTQKNPPFQIKISAVGYATQTVSVSSTSQKINVILIDEENKLNEIVVSASRAPERILQSPVTIVRMGLQQIKENTSPTVYDGLDNLKDVQINNSSMSFKSINARGFAAVGNPRFLQIVDGMDNQSPALNFPLGNLVGLSDIDISSVEMIPGASSALYGANAFNGILFMNSKNPFKDEGISGYFRFGQTSQDAAGVNNVYDYGVRAAKAFSKHFAAKVNLSYFQASEWIANNATSVTPGGGTSHATNQNYNGLNVYGDEITTFISNVGQVSRTGYFEQDLNDNTVDNLKADVSLYFRPWDNDTEIILQYKLGLGTTIFQGASRYSLDNFFMSQTRLEVKGKNFFVRAFLTAEDAGDSYNMTFAGWNVNRASKSDTEWFTNYATAFQLSGAVLGTNANQSAANARNYADYNIKPTGLEFLPNPTGRPRLEPGTPEFDNALQIVKTEPDLTIGAALVDYSRIYNAEGNYIFNDFIKFAEVQAGASVRQYELNSEGTLFTDYDGPISYNEFGAYVQFMDKYLDDRLKFTGSLRFDKAQNYSGNVSPRLSLVYSLGEQMQHNFRASYQTGFRNPTTQDQYIGLNAGPFALVGSAPENLPRYSEDLVVSAAGQALGEPAVVVMTGEDAYYNSYTLNSVTAFGAQLSSDPLNVPAAAALLEIANPTLVKPEEVHAFEVGYRSIVDRNLTIDANVYYNIYNNFINTARVVSPYYGNVTTAFDYTNPATLQTIAALSYGDRRVYQIYSNTSAQVTSFGFGIGLSKKVYKDFEVGVNYNFSEFQFDQTQDPAFITGFNTPKHAVKGSIGNASVYKNLGFNINVRWNTEYVWQSSFADGIIPENTVMDAQINYDMPKLKSIVKLGGANLFADEYVQVYGAGNIGTQWYISWTVNL